MRQLLELRAESEVISRRLRGKMEDSDNNTGSSGRRRPRAVFMAFGTQGDVHPVAAIAAAFASDQEQYDVSFVTHSAHKSLSAYLEAKNVCLHFVSSPPTLSTNRGIPKSNAELRGLSFIEHKKVIRTKHRQECLFLVEQIFGDCPSLNGDFFVINFFALEGWSLAELFQVRCVVAAPYVVPYSSPASFERQFRRELPCLFKFFKEAPIHKVNWRDVMHWMWPLFTEDWGSWRQNSLNLSPFPFLDPVTFLPSYNLQEESPLLLYGFSKQIVECPGYWPYNTHVCGFWFLPSECQFSCRKCRELCLVTSELCSVHADLQQFLEQPSLCPPIFVGLNSIVSMGFLQNPGTLISVLKAVLDNTNYKFILFTGGYEPLDEVIQLHLSTSSASGSNEVQCCKKEGVLFNNRLFFFSGYIPYSWLFPKCAVVIHHGGSGTTAASLHAGTPQIACPFILDQFYWAERMCWLGVAVGPLQKKILIPDHDDSTSIKQSAEVLKEAIVSALSPKIKERALQIAESISSEDGVQEVVKILKEKIVFQR